MAHYAKLDKDNIVLEVNVIDNDQEKDLGEDGIVSWLNANFNSQGVSGGVTWKKVMSGMEPNGYRSCIDFYEDLVLVVGRGSSDYYREGDQAYTKMDGQYYSVSTSKDGKSVWSTY